MTDAAFNRGLAAFLDDGGSSDAVIKAFPKLPEAALKKLVAEYRDIFSAACRCVINYLEERKTEDVTRDAVAEIDKRVSAKNATLLYAVARTSAWRDGYS